MNADRLISMVIRQVMRRVIGRGITAGIKAVSGGKSSQPGKKRNDPQGRPVPGAAQDTKRARQAMRAARRLGRF